MLFLHVFCNYIELLYFSDLVSFVFFFFKQKTAYELRISDWSSDVCSSDLFAFEADMLRALAKVIERGHLARGVKPVHWCFDCGSALAEAEIDRKSVV